MIKNRRLKRTVSGNSSLRILFVAMPQSVHTSRWISQVAHMGWDIRLFSVTDGLPHLGLRNVTIYSLSRYRPKGLHSSVRIIGLWPWRLGAEFQLYILRRFVLGRALHAVWLALVIRSVKPTIIHSLEIQHAAYLTLTAKAYFSRNFPTWLVTSWGSDIYLFGRLADHIQRIKAVLQSCDYFQCDCKRDVELAREIGLTAEVLPVLPGGGGFDLDRAAKLRQQGPVSSRRLVLLKGYQHWAGRSLVGLQAIALCAEELRTFRIAVYLATEDVRIAAELISHSTGLLIDSVPPTAHDEMLRLYGQARISIGLSISDGLPNSLLEAMIMGAFPIQSNTACADEWITDGRTGLLVSPEDPYVVAAALRRALSDDQLVDDAAEQNYQQSRERLRADVLQKQVVNLYQSMAVRPRRRR